MRRCSRRRRATRRCSARALVNAAGPVGRRSSCASSARLPRREGAAPGQGQPHRRARLFEHDHAYIFQNPDQRIIFAIPYEGDFTLIGTTDVEHRGAIGAARASTPTKTRYLCEQASRYFAQAGAPDDVVWSYSGVRPLLDDEASDASAVTRDYLLELDDARRRRCCRSGAARSRPSASSPRKRPTCSCAARSATRRARAPGPRGALLPGGDLSALDRHAAASRRRLRALRAGARRAPSGAAGAAARAAARAATARASSACSQAAARRRGGARRCTRPSCATCATHEWARSRRRRAVAAHQARPAPERRRARARRAVVGRATERDADARAASREARMELTLEGIEQQVGADTYLYPLDLRLVPRRGDGAARRHASRQDHADAPDGRARSAEQGPRQRRRRRRDRRAGARAQRLDGLPAVHQLPVDDRVRQHRLAAEAARRADDADAARARSSPRGCTSSRS